MECNREEAFKANELAHKYFSDEKYSAARKLALKSQAIYPELEGVTDFLAVLDVFVSSEIKIGDITDWYHVLGVNPYSDKATIATKYRRMSRTLHPDKNKSVGSADAFNRVTNAYKILTDEESRAKYDSTRNQPFLAHTNERPSPFPVPDSQRRMGTFWTFCKNCHHAHRYRVIFQDQTLVCTICLNPFVANRVPTPPGEARQNQQRNPHHCQDHPSSTAPSTSCSAQRNPHHCQDYPHLQQQQQKDSSTAALFSPETPSDQENTTSGHGQQGSRFLGSSNFADEQTNVGSRFSRYWPGLNLNFDLNLGSNINHSTSKTNSMKRTFNEESAENAVNGQDDERGSDNSKKRNVGDGRRGVCDKFFPNNDDDDDDEEEQ